MEDRELRPGDFGELRSEFVIFSECGVMNLRRHCGSFTVFCGSVMEADELPEATNQGRQAFFFSETQVIEFRPSVSELALGADIA